MTTRVTIEDLTLELRDDVLEVTVEVDGHPDATATIPLRDVERAIQFLKGS